MPREEIYACFMGPLKGQRLILQRFLVQRDQVLLRKEIVQEEQKKVGDEARKEISTIYCGSWDFTVEGRQDEVECNQSLKFSRRHPGRVAVMVKLARR